MEFAMIYTKDHKTLNMFDPLERFGPKRRKLLEQSWAQVFRDEILPELPVELLSKSYHASMGRPSKELFAMLGLMILQQMHDRTDEEAVYDFAFNELWHHALDMAGASDVEAYVCPKTIWSVRTMLVEHDRYVALFEAVTDKLAKVYEVDTSKQRLDSMHIHSNMRHLGRIGLFVNTIKKFLVNLKRHHQERFASLDQALISRYFPQRGESAFSMVKPSESAKTLASVSQDLFCLIERFRHSESVTQMNSYQLLVRLFKEQCRVEDTKTQDNRVVVKPNKEVPSDSLQNPSDPQAGYRGHKGKGYQVQVAETYGDDKQLSLITYVSVESADKSDTTALIPTIKDTQQRGLSPKEVLADSAYGSDDNCEKAKALGVELVSPAKGPDTDKALSLADFTLSERRKVTACPQGHGPMKTKHKKGRYTASFNAQHCKSCPCLCSCPVVAGKKAYYLRYDDKALRLATRRAYEKTLEFRDRYRFRAGIEATNSALDRKTGVKQLRVRGLKAVSLAATLKAAALNILRAAAFRARTQQPNPAMDCQTQEPWNNICVFKEQWVSKFTSLLAKCLPIQPGYNLGLRTTA
jgi:hypothetical protein